MTVRVEHPAPGVAELVMDRPEALNALSTEQARALTAAGRAVAADRRITVVVLASASTRAFCVGADLKERQHFGPADFAAQRPVFVAAFAAVRELEIPTIAAVDGFALGGGCELALSCDLVVASATAVFALPEARLGLVPGGGGTQLLPRRVGPGRAADLIFTGRQVEAAEAYRIGLADRLVPPDTARRHARELAQSIAGSSPVSLRAAKAAMRSGLDTTLAEGLQLEGQAWETAASSADRVEGIDAFNNRRTPRWPSAHPADSPRD